MRTAQSRRHGRRNIECPCHVAQAVLWCKTRLRFRVSLARHEISPDGYAPSRCERTGNQLALVETAFPQPPVREWNRNERRSLFDDVDGPGETRHSLTHSLGGSPPAVVLECVNDRASRAARRPTHGSDGSDERRKKVAPPTAVLDVRVSAPRALWVRKRVETRPAAAADDTTLVGREWALADDTRSRQEQIGNTAGGIAEQANRRVDAQCRDRVKPLRHGPIQRATA